MVRASGATGVHSRRIAERDSRGGRDEGGFEVRSSRCSEFRTPNVELQIAPFSHVSRFTRHGLWRMGKGVSWYAGVGRVIRPTVSVSCLCCVSIMAWTRLDSTSL